MLKLFIKKFMMNMKRIRSRLEIRNLFAVVGLAVLFGNSITLCWIFFQAYFHHSKSVTVYVNYFGEANFEAIFIPISFVFSVYSVIFCFKNFPMKVKRNV